MSNARLFKGYLNPLAFCQAEEPWQSHLQLTLESILRYACTPGIDPDPKNLVDRYREISCEDARLHVAPAEDRILHKLVWPLRHAKASYMFGNYLGTISLCGTVAEMVAILLHETSDIKVKDKALTLKDLKRPFGKSFEKLGQAQRVDILHALGIVDDKDKEAFDEWHCRGFSACYGVYGARWAYGRSLNAPRETPRTSAETPRATAVPFEAFDLIRTERKKSLHLWSHDQDTLPNDAVRVFKAAVSLVVRAIGQDFDDGKFVLSPRLARYLDNVDHFEPDTDAHVV